jgi:hypothetical protein
MLPNGRQKQITIDMPEPVEEAAKNLIEKGCHFDIEILTTGAVSMTCEKDEECIAIEICTNGEQVPIHVKKLVQTATNLLEENEKTKTHEDNQAKDVPVETGT